MIYLDNAATSFPKPEPVYQALDRFARTNLANPGRAGHRMAIAAEQTLDSARHALNQFFHGEAVARSNSDATDGTFRIVPTLNPPNAATRVRVTATGAASGDNLGFAVAGVGDVNADGFRDFAVGSYANDAGGAILALRRAFL